jgi:hypothetical protein
VFLSHTIKGLRRSVFQRLRKKAHRARSIFSILDPPGGAAAGAIITALGKQLIKGISKNPFSVPPYLIISQVTILRALKALVKRSHHTVCNAHKKMQKRSRIFIIRIAFCVGSGY